MDDTNQDGSEVLETTETEAEAVETTDTLTPEEIAELKAEAAKAKDLEAKNKQLFERAKKAEEAKKTPATEVQSQPTLSQKDVVYLAKADIHDDDIDDITNYASRMGVSVKDAHEHYKPILAQRAEERRTAAATHTKGGARGASKPSGEDLLSKAERTGEIPESEEGMQAIIEARLARKKSRK